MSSEILSTHRGDTEETVLEIRDLRVSFEMDTGTVHAVNGANFNIGRGETVCVVGETGAGKSVTAFSVMRLLGAGGVSQRASLDGDIVFRPGDGKEYHILSLETQEMLAIRGRHISMIYQEPMNSLILCIPAEIKSLKFWSIMIKKRKKRRCLLLRKF